MTSQFVQVTELSNDRITREQLDKICNRYYWAGTYCADKEVAEVACGAGQGIGYLAAASKSFTAGDYSPEVLASALSHYGGDDGRNILIQQFSADDMPFEDGCMDVILILEAIYYLPDVERFLVECRRVLRTGGKLLISSYNKDTYDFHPSPYSRDYYGAAEMSGLLADHGFSVEVFGDTAISSTGLIYRLLRPIKRLAVASGLMPKTMSGKKWLKRLVYGSLVTMPPEITAETADYVVPIPLPNDQACTDYKILFFAASRV